MEEALTAAEVEAGRDHLLKLDSADGSDIDIGEVLASERNWANGAADTSHSEPNVSRFKPRLEADVHEAVTASGSHGIAAESAKDRETPGEDLVSEVAQLDSYLQVLAGGWH